jgi:hypothetical protein
MDFALRGTEDAGDLARGFSGRLPMEAAELGGCGQWLDSELRARRAGRCRARRAGAAWRSGAWRSRRAVAAESPAIMPLPVHLQLDPMPALALKHGTEAQITGGCQE